MEKIQVRTVCNHNHKFQSEDGCLKFGQTQITKPADVKNHDAFTNTDISRVSKPILNCILDPVYYIFP